MKKSIIITTDKLDEIIAEARFSFTQDESTIDCQVRIRSEILGDNTMYECGDEFLELYPHSITVRGIEYPMKIMDREQFYIKYWEAINCSVTEHEIVIVDLKWGISKGLIPCKLEKFIGSRYWESLRPMRLTGFETDDMETFEYSNFNI